MVDRLTQDYAGKVEIRVLKEGADAERLAQAYRVRYVPTFVFLHRDGTVRHIVVGGMSEQAFRTELDALQ